MESNNQRNPRCGMSTYREMRCRHQLEVNDFPIAYAFSDEGFAAGMKKLGLNPQDTDKICSLGGTGGFFRKSDMRKLNKMFARHKRERDEAIAADTKGTGYIYQMFLCELASNEFDFTENLEDTLAAVDLTPEAIEKSKPLKRGLELAIKVIKKGRLKNVK